MAMGNLDDMVALLHVEEKTRAHPSLKPLHDWAMAQLAEAQKFLGASVPAEPNFTAPEPASFDSRDDRESVRIGSKEGPKKTS